MPSLPKLQVPWLAGHVAAGLLTLTLAGLAIGGGMHLAGRAGAGNAAWLAVSVCGLIYAIWTMADGLHKRRAGVDVIAVLALGGAVAVGELLAGAVISVMLASGRALEEWAAGKAQRDLTALLERAPKEARRYRDGALTEVPLDQIAPGDVLMVARGDVVPVDGTVAAGNAVLDESALTGEPVPVEHPLGDLISSGVVNTGPPFDLLADAKADESTYAGIVRLVSEAEHSRPPFVRLADRYALWFLIVTLSAAAMASAFGGASRAVAVLVVATPCPLILAAPVALVSGMSIAARQGVVVKGGGVLEKLASCTTLLLDKTGTLTTGHPTVAAVLPASRWQPDEMLGLAASLDQASGHVLAGAVVSAAKARACELSTPRGVEDIPGRGIRGIVNDHEVSVGKAAWCGIRGPEGVPGWAKAARRRATLDGALTVFVAVDGEPAGVLILDDPVRPDAARTIRALRGGGIDRIVMVTGDRAEVAETVGSIIGIDGVLAERAPDEKLDAVRSERRRGPVLMVGDGINDAPALALADVGVALGSRGATASSQAADAVLTVDRLDRLGNVISVARRTRQIAIQSVVAGLAMSLAAMGFAAAGLLPAVWGALLQEGIDVAVIVNALRALRPPISIRELEPSDAALTSRFQREHATIWSIIEELRAAADSLGFVASDDAIARIRRTQQLLVSEVMPHEQAEDVGAVSGAQPHTRFARGHGDYEPQPRRDRPPDQAARPAAGRYRDRTSRCR